MLSLCATNAYLNYILAITLILELENINRTVGQYYTNAKGTSAIWPDG